LWAQKIFFSFLKTKFLFFLSFFLGVVTEGIHGE